MSLLFTNDKHELPSDPPLHPLAPPDSGTKTIPPMLISPLAPPDNVMAVPLNPTSVYQHHMSAATSNVNSNNNANVSTTIFTQPSNNSQQTDGSRSAFRSLGSDKNSSVGIKPVLPEMSPQIGRRTDQNSQEESTRSAFRPVGGATSITSPAVKPGVVPLVLDRSPLVSRRLDMTTTSSDQDTVSPTPSSTASESQPATPAIQEPFTWPTHNSEENRQLLGTEEESSDRQSSDDEEEKNVWLITQEQMSYYTTQFRSMQPNLIGVIPGTQAKEFFEKSRLPIQELRKIWQLSDVTKDGCLSLEEFLTAMHLVVLRRNDISLPDELPPCLNPLNLKHKVVDRHNKDLYDVSNQRTHTILDTSAANDSLELSPTSSRNGVSNAGGSGGSAGGGRAALDSTADSVVSPESIISSPGGRPKPVKFDFNAVDPSKDPSIAVPIPHRASPESPILQTSDEDTPQTMGIQPFQKPGKHRVLYEQLRNQEDSGGRQAGGARGAGGGTSRGGGGSRNRSWSTDSSSSSDDATDKDDLVQPLSSSPLSRITGPVSLPYIQSEPIPATTTTRGPLALQKKEGVPPSPPPRPGKTHARSSSLDLAQLNKKMPGLPSLLSRTDTSSRRIVDSTEELEHTVRDYKEISANIHKYKESVALLKRTVTELSQEVSDTMEERVVLEYQLEQLKSFGNQD